jgi:hypothetical protein
VPADVPADVRAVVEAGGWVCDGDVVVFAVVAVTGTVLEVLAVVAALVVTEEAPESGADRGSGARPHAAAATARRTAEGITLFIGHHLSVT